MPLDPTYIRSRVPVVFDAVPDFALTEAITAAQNQINVGLLGARAGEALFLLSCHYASLYKPGRADGQQRSEADRVKLDFGGQGQKAMTSFYASYLKLLKNTPALRLGVVTVDGSAGLPGGGGDFDFNGPI